MKEALTIVVFVPYIQLVKSCYLFVHYQQGDLVRKLKEENAPDNDVKVALRDLKAAKKILEDKVNNI